MKKIFIILWILVVSNKIYSQQKSYEISFSTCLNKEIAEETFKDKYIVLDFWQTWCAPCIASFEDTNDLMRNYSSSEIVFANITNEKNKIDRIKRILEISPFNGYQLIDNDNYTYNQFKIHSFPTVVILDKKGRLLWKGNPGDLSQKLIFRITGIKSKTIKKAKSIEKNDYILKINNSESEIINSSSMSERNDYFVLQYNSNSLHNVLVNFFKTSSKRIVSNDPNSNSFGIDIFGKFPTRYYSKKDINELILNKLKDKYKFTYTTIKENENIYIVEVQNEKLLKEFETNDSHASCGIAKKSISFHGYSLENIFLDFENADASDNYYRLGEMASEISQKTYDMTLYFDKEKLKSKLKKNYGLILKEKKEPVSKLKLVFNKK